MVLDVRLLVTDASPLITLAAAGSLDYMLYASVPVLIPDAVFHEATAASDKLGAVQIIEWYRTHADVVRVEPTEVFQLSARLPRLPRDLGERAALEVVRESRFLSQPEDRALVLTDDRDVQRLVAVDPARVILLTMWDYLLQLEAARRIQSADAVMEAARRAGRSPAPHGLWDRHDPEVRDAVQSILRRPDDA